MSWDLPVSLQLISSLTQPADITTTKQSLANENKAGKFKRYKW